MLTFKNPYLDPRSLHQTSLNVMEATPIPPRKLVPWLPAEIEAITLKAMHGDPDKRYRTMREFADDVVRYQNGEQVHAQPPTAMSRVKHFVKKYKSPLIIGTLIVAFSLLYGFSYYFQAQKGKSHWQLIVNEKFSGKTLSENWIMGGEVLEDDTSTWRLFGGQLHCSTAVPTFLRFERHFFRDIKLECQVKAAGDDFFDIGFFLNGNAPDSAYCFHIHRHGKNRNGITFPGNSFLHYSYNPLEFPIDTLYRIAIERRANELVFFINNIEVAKIFDFYPPLGAGHQKIGIFVKGGECLFDNVKIYQWAIPLSPSPTIIADRFLERGDFATALEEYRGLHMDFPNAEITPDILLRIAECQLRMGRSDDALRTLNNRAFQKSKNETMHAKVLYFKRIAHASKGETGQADSVFKVLSSLYPLNDITHAATVNILLNISRALEQDNPRSAEAMLTDLFTLYPRSIRECGKLHIEIMKYYLRRGQNTKAIAVGEQIVSTYIRAADIRAEAQVLISEALLSKRYIKKAIDHLNRCVATYVLSEGVWDAWMKLASIYEYEFNTKDALTIYRKVNRECPPSLVVHWMARIKMGEIASRRPIGESADDIFESVIDDAHPFPLPRIIAQFYTGALSESQFTERWQRLFPSGKGHLYHLAKKAAMENEQIVASIYLKELVQSLSQSSWEYLRIYRILANLSKW
jgi:tetratricopeptide (TPR) repeat protein